MEPLSFFLLALLIIIIPIFIVLYHDLAVQLKERNAVCSSLREENNKLKRSAGEATEKKREYIRKIAEVNKIITSVNKDIDKKDPAPPENNSQAISSEHPENSTMEEAKRQTILAKREAAYAISQSKQLFFERQKYKKEYLKARDALEESYKAKLDEELRHINLCMQLSPALIAPVSNLCDIESYQSSIMQGILQHAFDAPPDILSLKIEAEIHSVTTNEKYTTSLSSCTCNDRKFRDRPCKHMLYLAYLLGLLQIDQKAHKKAVEEYNALGVDFSTLKQKISNEKKAHDKLVNVNDELIRTINEAPNAYPRISGLMADLITLQFTDSERYLRSKRPHAKKAADEVAKMRNEVHSIIKRNKELEEKIETFERWFPNIHDVLNKDFKVDMWELEPREPNVYEIKDYISKHINSIKYNNIK